ncbi:MAG: hypothetical protein ACK56F_21045, partial [bacterium]
RETSAGTPAARALAIPSRAKWARLLARVVRTAFADRGLVGLGVFVDLPFGAFLPVGLPVEKGLMINQYQPNQRQTR